MSAPSEPTNTDVQKQPEDQVMWGVDHVLRQCNDDGLQAQTWGRHEKNRHWDSGGADTASCRVKTTDYGYDYIHLLLTMGVLKRLNLWMHDFTWCMIILCSIQCHPVKMQEIGSGSAPLFLSYGYKFSIHTWKHDLPSFTSLSDLFHVCATFYVALILVWAF